MLKRCPVGFFCRCPPMKCRTKPLLNCLKLAIVPKGSLANYTLVAPLSGLLERPCTLLHLGSSAKVSKSWMIQCDPRDLLNHQITPLEGGGTSVGEDDSTPQWWMVNPSFELFRPSYPQLCLLLHSWARPSPSSCYEIRSPLWMSFLPMLLSSYWPGYSILPHYGFLWSSNVLLHFGFQQSVVVPYSEIQQLSLALHSSESIPPH